MLKHNKSKMSSHAVPPFVHLLAEVSLACMLYVAAELHNSQAWNVHLKSNVAS